MQGFFIGWLVLTRPVWLLIHQAGGPGVDLASDWSVVQWCVRYFGCLTALMIPLMVVRHQITQRTDRWEVRLRREQEAVAGAAPAEEKVP